MSSYETRLLAEANRLARAEGWKPYGGAAWCGYRQPHGDGWTISWHGNTMRLGYRISDTAYRLIADVRVAKATQALDILTAYGILPLWFATAFDAALDPDYAERCEAGRRTLGANTTGTEAGGR